MEPIHVKNVSHAELLRQATASGACAPSLRWLLDGQKDLKTAYAQVEELSWVRYFFNEMTWLIRMRGADHLAIEALLYRFEDRRRKAQKKWVADTESIWDEHTAAQDKIEADYRAESNAIDAEAHRREDSGESIDWHEVRERQHAVWDEAQRQHNAQSAITNQRIEPFNAARERVNKRANRDELKLFKSLIIVDD